MSESHSHASTSTLGGGQWLWRKHMRTNSLPETLRDDATAEEATDANSSKKNQSQTPKEVKKTTKRKKSHKNKIESRISKKATKRKSVRSKKDAEVEEMETVERAAEPTDVNVAIQVEEAEVSANADTIHNNVPEQVRVNYATFSKKFTRNASQNEAINKLDFVNITGPMAMAIHTDAAHHIGSCTISLLSFLLFMYMLLGGLLFSNLENNPGSFNVSLRHIQDVFLQEHQQCVTNKQLVQFTNQILSTPRNNRWEFADSVLFSMTVVTTIGYGDMHPRTEWGKRVCVLYAIFGIPLTLVLLGQVGNHLRYKINTLTRHRWFQDAPRPTLMRLVVIFQYNTLSFMVLMLLPAMYYSIFEKWDFEQALYFCFVTLTTIGFGDLVPHDSAEIRTSVWYQICTCIWLIFGLVWIASVFRLLEEHTVRFSKMVENKYRLYAVRKYLRKRKKILEKERDKIKPVYNHPSDSD